MAERRFSGASVLVSGAARGFGQLAAIRFANEGAGLVLCDVDAEALARTAHDCRALGAQVHTHAGDVGTQECAKALVDLAVAHFGRLDVALNNAGVAHPLAKLADIAAVEAERIIRINLMGVFLAMKYQLPVMAAQNGGAILNVASVAGLVGAPLMSAYAASKHGVIGLTKSAAVEYAKSNIRINAICPAFSATPMVDGLLQSMGDTGDAALARMVAHMPMRRVGTPDEIVDAMLWMLSPANSFMTGQAVAFDGGLTAT